MNYESCTNCIHFWVCGLPSSYSGKSIKCPGFLDKDKCKEIIYAKWIVPDDNYPYTCSNCLFEFVWDGEEDYRPKFCPHCGALMILGEFDHG